MNYNYSIKKLQIVVVDGFPITKCTSDQFWPILAYIRPLSNAVFPIGIYLEVEKHFNSNDFLKDFVIDSKNLISNGITINNIFYQISIDVKCCDTLSKSLCLK